MSDGIGLAASKAPLWITPLFDKKEEDSGNYRTVVRVVTKTPNPSCLDTPYGEVETTLEEYLGPSGETLWRRVAVRGYTDSKRVLHASFKLPDEESLLCASTLSGNEGVDTDHIMCWTSFPDRPDHKLLCVLVSPLLLCIYDAYPVTGDDTNESIGGGEGHHVPLPFEARGIFPIGGHDGLLLQRRPTLEDRILDESIKASTWVTRGGLDDEYDDAGFVLQDPPKPVRLGNVLTSPAGMEMTIAQPSPQSSGSAEPLPSLFTLKHPLDELKPMTKREVDASHSFFSDIHETILFVGNLTWADHSEDPYKRNEHVQPICVTYHSQQKRHAIWEISSAPPPAPTPPLWQVSRKQREEKNDGGDISFMHDPHVMNDGNLGRMGISDPDTSWRGTTNRNEALADALGVNKSKKAEDPVASRVRGGDRSRRSGGFKVPHASMLTPPPPVQPSGNESKDRSQLPLDPGSSTPDLTKVAPRAFSPFADLSPDFALTMLYKEDSGTAECPATNVFVASNVEASGTLTVCLVCPAKSDLNPSLLRWFCLNVKKTNARNAYSVRALPEVPCISAQPVQAAPVPCTPCASGSRKRRQEEALATDVIVLLGEAGRKARETTSNRMVLYHSGLLLAECALPRTPSIQTEGSAKKQGANVIGMKFPVADCVDYICADDNGATRSVRGKICLRFPSSPISDAVLAASDTSFFLLNEPECSRKAIETGLKIRIDCVRLSQAISSMQDAGQLEIDDNVWPAVECVLSSYIEAPLIDRGQDSTRTRSSTPRSEKPTGDDHWSTLLNSGFDSHLRDEVGSTSMYFGPNEELDLGTRESKSVKVFEILRDVIAPTWLRQKGKSIFTSPETTDQKALRVFDSLHLLYEESKLSSCRTWLRTLGNFLAKICVRMGRALGESNAGMNRMGDFLDHYRRDLGTECSKDIEASSETTVVSSTGSNYRDRQVMTSFVRPPSFLEWADSKMKGADHQNDSPTTNFYDLQASAYIPPVFRFTRALHRAFSVLYGEDSRAADQSQRDKTVIQIIIQEGIRDADDLRDELPPGLALPLLEVLHRCRADPDICSTTSMSVEAWSLLGRTDMTKHSSRVAPQHTHGGNDAFRAYESRCRELLADADKDGIQPLEVTSSMLFPDDNRVREVGRLLRSSRPIFLQVQRAVEVSDHDYERLKQERLLVLCRRAFAVPLGRGMLTFGNLKPVPAEPLPVPTLCLSGRVPPTNNTLALDASSCSADLKVWPEFHNGVAAGLRLSIDEGEAENSVHQITRTWIAYNRGTTDASTEQNQANNNPDSPAPPNHAHGGLLMALGLRGHLATLMMTDIYDYLTQGVVTTTVGILIGMAANKRGSCDPLVSKMLCLHIPSLLPASFTAMDVAGPAQAAAVAGIGLLYQGSSHRLMTEFLLEEMGKRPTNDSITIDREAYTLSCGIALGMVNLAKGTKSSGGDGGNGWSGLADLDLDERLHRFVVGGIDDAEQQRRQEALDRGVNSFGMSNNDNERCSRVWEGNTVNTDITAPGATLALGLMYMKSGNHAIASSIALPDTHFLLEYVRPDMLLLRVLSRSLILWDQVDPSSHWIDDQIPLVVKTTHDQMRAAVEKASDYTNLSRHSHPGADTEGSEAEDNPADGTSTNQNAAALHDDSIDRQAVRQIYVNVVAGACFGIGLRFAGTGDKHAASAIAERVMELKAMRDGNDPVSSALRPELAVLEMCLGSACISLAMVMAGTGDLDTFRLLRVIRWRCDNDIRYGSHMAYGAALGLLFLGGGTCTLGRSPEDIAALVLAFFPRFPAKTSDNQHHLQALRHCYALAVVKREVRAIDSDTGETVSVPIEIDYVEPGVEPTKATAPCLLLNANGSPSALRVASNRYYPLTLDIRSKVGLTFFVKKRNGHFGPERSLRTGGDWMESFTDSPIMMSYAQYLYEQGKPQSWVSDFLRRLLQECLVNDTEEAIPLYLKLKSSVEALDIPACTFWDVRLIRTYYEKHGGARGNRLLSAEFVSLLIERVEQKLAASSLDESDVLVYMKSGERRTAVEDGGQFGSFLTWFDAPFPSKTIEIVESMELE